MRQTPRVLLTWSLGCGLVAPGGAASQERRSEPARPAASCEAADSAPPAPADCARRTEIAARYGRPRVYLGVGRHTWLTAGGDVPLRRAPRWAVHGRIGGFAPAPILGLGVRRTLVALPRGEINLIGLVAALGCDSILEGPCPLDGRARQSYEPAVGALLQASGFGLAGSGRWAGGIEAGYIHRFPADDSGLRVWTFGLAIQRLIGPLPAAIR